MEEMIAFCGLACHECGALIATKNNDDQKRAEVARLWSKQFKAEVNPGDINCEGCLSMEGRLFKQCKICKIRNCGLERELTSCAQCEEYPCTKLDFIFKHEPDAKKRLDAMRA